MHWERQQVNLQVLLATPPPSGLRAVSPLPLLASLQAAVTAQTPLLLPAGACGLLAGSC